MKKIIWISMLIIAGLALYFNSEKFIHYKEELTTQLMPDPMTYNSYDKGQCTYYVFEKVKADGNMIGSSWSDAKYWALRAQKEDYKVNHKPVKGALLQSPRGKQGHVAYVEHVYQNGKVKVSEMNYIKPYEVSQRILTVNDLKRYQFIHPKENPKRSPS